MSWTQSESWPTIRRIKPVRNIWRLLLERRKIRRSKRRFDSTLAYVFSLWTLHCLRHSSSLSGGPSIQRKYCENGGLCSEYAFERKKSWIRQCWRYVPCSSLYFLAYVSEDQPENELDSEDEPDFFSPRDEDSALLTNVKSPTNPENGTETESEKAVNVSLQMS